jgi:hypothetical protein
MINKNMINNNMINKNMINNNMINKNMINKNLINKNLINKNLINKNLINNNMINNNNVIENNVNNNNVNENNVNNNNVNENNVNENNVNENNVNNIYLDDYHKFYYPQNNFNKTLILYVFHEFNDRVDNFIKNCIFRDEKFDFIIIINNINFDINILSLPDYVTYIVRENIGFDFGGWSYGLLKDELYKNYDSFIFINSSVYGPCMEIDDNRKWPDILLNGLYYNNIKLFGTTINCINDGKNLSHVQSMVFCMDLETLEFLISKDIFSLTNFDNSLINTINNKEIRMSREIINNGWNIGCLHIYYKDIDFTFKSYNRNIIYLNDVCYKNSFFGKTIHPYEILFVKGNRDINRDFIEKYTFRNLFNYYINYYVPHQNILNSVINHNNIIYDSFHETDTSFHDFTNSNLVQIINFDTLPQYNKISNKISNKIVEKFILVIDFPNYGGGTSTFLNFIIQKYKNNTLFMIIRNFNNVYYVTINDDYFYNKFEYTDIIIFLNNNKEMIDKIFINHKLGHTYDFLNYLFTFNKSVISITHDYCLFYNEPQYYFNDFVKNNELSRNIFDINKLNFIVIQNKQNLLYFDKFIIDKKKIIISELPDFKYSLTKINYDNNKIIIGIIGAINDKKGLKVLLFLYNYYKKNNNIKFIIFGKIISLDKYDFIDYEEYDTINHLNNLLKKYKPNLLLELTLWPETYSYTLTLGMLTQLPIICLKKNMISTVENRLLKYNKTYYFNDIFEFDMLIHKYKQNYLYTIQPIVYYNDLWDNYFIINKSNNIINLNDLNFYNNIICFIHVANLNKGLDIFKEQINIIKNSDLYNKLDYIFVTLLGDYVDICLDKKIKLIHYSQNVGEWEFSSIQKIKYISDLYKHNIKILYIHTKGTLNKPNSYEWRKYLEYFLIDKHNLCINSLNKYSCIGVNQQFYTDLINIKKNHFSGNFWWSNSLYIKNLPEFKNNVDRYFTEHYLIGDFSLYDPRYYLSLHHTPYNLYEHAILPNEYSLEIINKNILNNIKNSYVKTRNIYGIYFICCLGNYYNIVQEQISLLLSSGLYDISEQILCFICLEKQDILNYFKQFSKIKIISTTKNLFEKFAINNYKKYINGEYYLYYIHSKSVSRNEKCYIDWRILCDHFTINKWRLSIELLTYYDCVGINLKNFPKIHFSGNYWWSKSEHLNKLQDINDNYYLSPEMYICSYSKTNKICIYNSNITHGNTEYDKGNYINKTDEDIIMNITMVPEFNEGDKHLTNY